MYGLASALQLLLMIVAPIALAWALVRRWKASSVLIGLGAVAWIGSQIVHMPLNELLRWSGALGQGGPNAPGWVLVVNAALLGLTAGLCEELARWLALRYAIRGARSWREAVIFGAGHGGFESVWLGVLVGATLLGNWATSRAGAGAMGLAPDQAAALSDQLAAYWAAPAWLPLLGAAERMMTVVFHITASALVMLSIQRRSPWPLVAAILWHALLDGLAGVVSVWASALVAELVLLGWMPICAVLLWATHRALARPPEAK